uniref:TLC domain-containing protein 4-A-like n=1 Tax=Styela clava TaxID=7725 RepID=UPI001939289E|nr:TLC domain-containing protein 4-A-like [Styela clava]
MLHTDAGHHVKQVIASFIFFEWISGYLSPYVAQFLPAYNALSTEKKGEFHSRTCSTAHAVIVSVLCVYIVVADEEAKKDMVEGDSWLARSCLAVAIGYLLMDLRYCIRNINKDLGSFLHHISAIYPYSLVILLGVLSYYANFRLMAEISTPFVNIRWYYDVTGRKNSQIYFYNGLFLAGTFFLFRIAVMPVYYYLVYAAVGTEAYDRLGLALQLSWIIPCIVLDVLNFLWFYKIMRGARKVMKKRKSKSGLNGHCLSTITEESNEQKQTINDSLKQD